MKKTRITENPFERWAWAGRVCAAPGFISTTWMIVPMEHARKSIALPV
jgi:hypothetical protein